MSQFELGEKREKIIKILIVIFSYSLSQFIIWLVGPNGGILTSLNLFATKFKKGEN